MSKEYNIWTPEGFREHFNGLDLDVKDSYEETVIGKDTNTPILERVAKAYGCEIIKEGDSQIFRKLALPKLK